MGLDLRLLPFEAPTFSHSILSCERRRVLFEQIQKLKSHPVPNCFASFLGDPCDKDCGESHYGETVLTPYGEALTWVYACELTQLSEHVDVLDNPINRAVWAYLRQLEPNTKIALYWH